jgi:hypothetical protein
VTPNTFTRRVHIHLGRHTRREVRSGPTPERPEGRTPRIAKLMALAIHFEDMVARGQIEDYATVARIGQVSRARVTQIVNLALLAPDIQEEILFLPKTRRNRDVLNTTVLQPLAREHDWQRQRAMWARLKDQLPAPTLVAGDGWEEVQP